MRIRIGHAKKRERDPCRSLPHPGLQLPLPIDGKEEATGRRGATHDSIDHAPRKRDELFVAEEPACLEDKIGSSQTSTAENVGVCRWPEFRRLL